MGTSHTTTSSRTSRSTPASRYRGSSPRVTEPLEERYQSPAGELRLRPALPEDESFLARLYGTTRDDLRAVGWSEEELAQVLEFQFRAQQADYARNYPAESHWVLELDGTPVGRLWIDRRPDQLHVIDLALLPEHRSKGLGTLLVRELLAEADEAAVPTRLESEHTNPRAIAFARRLGFVPERDDGIFLWLVRRPG